jgi:hypothetical protein
MAKLAALRQSGTSVRKIVHALDLSATTVARLVKEHAALARLAKGVGYGSLAGADQAVGKVKLRRGPFQRKFSSSKRTPCV